MVTPGKTGFVVVLHVKGRNLHDHQEPYIHDVACKRYTHLIPHPFKPSGAELQRELATVTDDLLPIVDGKSRTTVPQPLKSVTTGGYSIVLDGWDWAGTAAACGTIPKQ